MADMVNEVLGPKTLRNARRDSLIEARDAMLELQHSADEMLAEALADGHECEVTDHIWSHLMEVNTSLDRVNAMLAELGEYEP